MNSAINIKVWLIISGLKQNQIAREAGVSPPMVNFVVHGKSNNKAVIEAFVKHGCPMEYFEPANAQ